MEILFSRRVLMSRQAPLEQTISVSIDTSSGNCQNLAITNTRFLEARCKFDELDACLVLNVLIPKKRMSNDSGSDSTELINKDVVPFKINWRVVNPVHSNTYDCEFV
jgi:hypothetical protein